MDTVNNNKCFKYFWNTPFSKKGHFVGTNKKGFICLQFQTTGHSMFLTRDISCSEH